MRFSFLFLLSFAYGYLYTSCILCSSVFAAYLSKKKQGCLLKFFFFFFFFHKKLLAKVLANKLKKVVRTIVLNSQQTFVKGGQILNANLIATEVLNSRLKSWKMGIIYKLDIEKPMTM